MIPPVPLFWFRPNVAFLDDSKDFLEAIELYLPTTKGIFSTNPGHIQGLIIANDIRKEFSDFIQKEEEDLYEQTVLSLDLSRFSSSFSDILKSKQPISCLFVDQAMPFKTGLEVCEILSNVPTKKVLLTGELGLEEAIKAVNSNLIDAYLRKNNKSLVEEIHDLIVDNHLKYIRDISSTLAIFFQKGMNLRFIYEDHNVREFYWNKIAGYEALHACIYDFYGSQVLTDENDHNFAFNIYTSEELRGGFFPSKEYEESFNEKEKKKIEAFSLLVDYKQPNLDKIPSGKTLRSLLTDSFTKIQIKESTYFLTFKSLEGGR